MTDLRALLGMPSGNVDGARFNLEPTSLSSPFKVCASGRTWHARLTCLPLPGRAACRTTVS